MILGAWGCGAYGNPVAEIAGAWRRVLSDQVNGKEIWESIEEVIFAISARQIAEEFASCFSLLVEDDPRKDQHAEEEEEDEVAEELKEKITEMESQVQQVWRNKELKERMVIILEGLKRQLEERQGGALEEEEEVEDLEGHDVGEGIEALSDNGPGFGRIG